MSLNNIQLNSSLLTELYRNSLVELEDIHDAGEKDLSLLPEKKAEPAWKFLGKNQKNILLVVRYTDTAFLPDQQLNFITSVLGACKLSMVDVAIINLENAPAKNYKAVFEHFKSKVMILFDLTPAAFEMPVNFPEFQVQVFNNCTFLWNPGLEKLEADKVLKSKFWVSLRRIFEV